MTNTLTIHIDEELPTLSITFPETIKTDEGQVLNVSVTSADQDEITYSKRGNVTVNSLMVFQFSGDEGELEVEALIIIEDAIFAYIIDYVCHSEPKLVSDVVDKIVVRQL